MQSLSFQPVVDRYAAALAAPQRLFSFWPNPRPVGRPNVKLSALPAATTLAVIGAFEGFAEDLLASALVKQGRTWAHVAKNCDLTNPSVKQLAEKLKSSAGIEVEPGPSWTISLPKQTSSTGWTMRDVAWNDALSRSESWVQVRHCLSHGLVTGLGSEVWPGPVSSKNFANQSGLPNANDPDILATVRGHPDKRGLYFWPSVSAAKIYSTMAGVIASKVAAHFGESVDASGLDLFDNL